MLLLILCIVFIICGVLFIYIYNNTFTDYDTFFEISGLISLISGIIGTMICLICLLIKPIDYKEFKIDYEVVARMQTNSDDVRDATYTLQINEINKRILTCREYINSKWLGIYENKKICEYELLEKEN